MEIVGYEVDETRSPSSFSSWVVHEQQRLQKTYKCITCQYYEEINTAFGTICKCTYTNTNNSDFNLGCKKFLRGQNILHKLKKSCKHYKPHDTPQDAPQDTNQDNLLYLWDVQNYP